MMCSSTKHVHKWGNIRNTDWLRDVANTHTHRKSHEHVHINQYSLGKDQSGSDTEISHNSCRLSEGALKGMIHMVCNAI